MRTLSQTSRGPTAFESGFPWAARVVATLSAILEEAPWILGPLSQWRPTTPSALALGPLYLVVSTLDARPFCRTLLQRRIPAVVVVTPRHTVHLIRIPAAASFQALSFVNAHVACMLHRENTSEARPWPVPAPHRSPFDNSLGNKCRSRGLQPPLGRTAFWARLRVPNPMVCNTTVRPTRDGAETNSNRASRIHPAGYPCNLQRKEERTATSPPSCRTERTAVFAGLVRRTAPWVHVRIVEKAIGLARLLVPTAFAFDAFLLAYPIVSCETTPSHCRPSASTVYRSPNVLPFPSSTCSRRSDRNTTENPEERWNCSSSVVSFHTPPS